MIIGAFNNYFPVEFHHSRLGFWIFNDALLPGYLFTFFTNISFPRTLKERWEGKRFTFSKRWTSSVEATLFEHRRAVCLWGEKGSGKTALCLEFCRSLNLQMSINLDHSMNLFKWSSNFLKNKLPYPMTGWKTNMKPLRNKRSIPGRTLPRARVFGVSWPSLFLMVTIKEVHLLFSRFVSQIIFRFSVPSGTFCPTKTHEQ